MTLNVMYHITSLFDGWATSQKKKKGFITETLTTS